MRHGKKRVKLEIYTALMLSFVIVFLLNIALFTTTWAWFLSSISTGVNTITAGVDVNIMVKHGETPIPGQDGKYELKSGQNTIEIAGGSAKNGYVIFMDIYDENNPANAVKKYVNLGQETKNLTISIETSTPKTLSICSKWKENGIISGYEEIVNSAIDLSGGSNSSNSSSKTGYTINLLDENGTPLKQSDINQNISGYSASPE